MRGLRMRGENSRKDTREQLTPDIDTSTGVCEPAFLRAECKLVPMSSPGGDAILNTNAERRPPLGQYGGCSNARPKL
jgi:hypothetical protein